MGSIYQPKLRSGERSSIYWLKYYANGKCIRESTGTDNERKATRLLKEREGRVVTGQPILPRADKVTYTEIRDDLRRYYETTEDRNIVEVDKRLKHLDACFGDWRVMAIDRPAILRYVEQRQQATVKAGTVHAGAANGTINREVTLLGTMLRHAISNNRLVRLPDLRKIKLKEADPRSGFFEHDQYLAVKKHLPDDLQTAITIAYTYGWRMQSEVLSLELRHLDLVAGTLTLDAGMTKNDKGRTVYLTPEVKTLLSAQVARVKALERRLGRIIPYLFPYFDDEPHVSRRLVGTQRQNFVKAWATALKKAGLAGKLKHDFRRTAVRNLTRNGVTERVAMQISGHRTRAVFDRYDIVSAADLQEAARRISAATAL